MSGVIMSGVITCAVTIGNIAAMWYVAIIVRALVAATADKR